MDVIATYRLTKRYGRVTALDNLELRVPPGQLFGFLGPNGAGKTTAIRLLLGLLRASDGRADVLGDDAWIDGPRIRASVGYLPGDVRFYDTLTGRRTLEFFDRVRGSHAADETRRLTRAFDLNLDKRVRDYSRGMKQKLGVIAALMHRPKLLILDEPTVGLDPLVRETLYEELRRIAADGRTVLFSSHTLAEVEVLCDAVAILRDGRLVEHERMDVLRQRAIRHVEIRFADASPQAERRPEGLDLLDTSDRRWRATWQGPVDRLLGWLHANSVADVIIAPPDLEDLFLAYYTDTPGDNAAKTAPPQATPPAAAQAQENPSSSPGDAS